MADIRKAMGNTADLGDVVRADPSYRMRLLIAYTIGVVIAALILALGLPRGILYVRAMGWRTFDALRYFFLVLILCPAPAAIALTRIGMKILRTGAYPYPGMKVVRDTRIRRGRAAAMRGKAFVALGVFSILLSLVSVCVTYYYSNRLRGPVPMRFEVTSPPGPPTNAI